MKSLLRVSLIVVAMLMANNVQAAHKNERACTADQFSKVSINNNRDFSDFSKREKRILKKQQGIVSARGLKRARRSLFKMIEKRNCFEYGVFSAADTSAGEIDDTHSSETVGLSAMVEDVMN